jgi:hypothetical protein
MDKEKLLTIGIGLLVGVGVALLYFTATKFIPQITRKNPVAVIQPQAPSSPTPEKQTPFSLDFPLDNSTVTEAIGTVSGQTSPSANIIIFANTAEKIATAASDGKFNESIKLEEGLNAISVTVLSEQNNPVTIIRNVTLEISK